MTRRAAIALALIPGAAMAHVSERALVMLLPTDIYIASGMAVMVATVALLIFLPPRALHRAFAILPLSLLKPKAAPLRGGTSARQGALEPNAKGGAFGSHKTWRRFIIPRTVSLLAGMCVLGAIWAGFAGSRDPLSNPITLLVWTVLWVALPLTHAVFGNLWRGLNPWTGLYSLVPVKPFARLPRRLGALPACAVFIAFALFMIADIAPADPTRLATFAALYWLATFAGLIAFGPRWLLMAEPFTVLFRLIARLAPLWRHGFALPGARLIGLKPRRGTGLIALLWLGIGSFDGLNETFWWLAKIGVNPLAFPGRSAVVSQSTLGLLAGIALLLAVFLAATLLGLWLAKAQATRGILARLMLTVLPIALGYHLAHYLTQLLVNGQHLMVVLSDPMDTGADLLGLGEFYVSTGFFNRPASVQAIWLTQAGAVVLGHCLAVVLAHAVALDALGSRARATLSQAPVAAFMIAYTFFGLWLLAQPTGA